MDQRRAPLATSAVTPPRPIQHPNGGSGRHQQPYPSSALPSPATAAGAHYVPGKSSKLYIRDRPRRAIAIVSSTHALIFRHNPATKEAIANGYLGPVPGATVAGGGGGGGGGDGNGNGNGGGGGQAIKAMVEYVPLTRNFLDSYRPLTHRPIYGTLGLIALDGEAFLCVVAEAVRAATVRPGENVERIAGTAFFSLSSSEWDDVVMSEPTTDQEPGDVLDPYGQSLRHRELRSLPPYQALQKLLRDGSFYYSTDFDVTNRCQERSMDDADFDFDNINRSFLWNEFLIEPLLKFRSHLLPHERAELDASKFLTLAFRGFCQSIPTSSSIRGPHPPKRNLRSSLTIISRLSCKRAGTRFLSRGIDDDGNVANFVETETTYWTPSGTLFSYAQVRGSVPVFWEQATEIIPGRQTITITRSADGAQHAFDHHFGALAQRYSAVHALNLLSETKPNEAELSHRYRHGLRSCPLSRDQSRDHALLRLTDYDFHAETSGPAGYDAANGIRLFIADSIENFAYYLAEETDDSDDLPTTGHGNNNSFRTVVVLQQEGVFRTNCLDCLDRTNLIQTIISRMAMEAFLSHRGERAPEDLWRTHSTLWADNGDALSKVYAGTGALKSSFTRHGKSSLFGTLADMRKSVSRLYQNNFVDPGKQVTIDMLLGRLLKQTQVHLFDPISDFVSAEIYKRRAEFSSKKTIRIHVGSFNLNGRTDGTNQDLSPWLCPPDCWAAEEQPDIVAVGFQEIVELSPQHIVNTDPARKQMWEQVVKTTLNDAARKAGREGYVLLRSGQLVGAALCIFVSGPALREIKNVEGSIKKTGMQGMAGNKGAVAIRMDYANTSVCFVTAHLAAGFTNYDERNRDFKTISDGLRFQRGRRIDDHDSVIWMGDFNYRIGLSREDVMEHLRVGNTAALFENDQLNLQMMAGLAFPHYSEARIKFPPTYKFDIGTDNYDSSEKARIPAWTDRILRKGKNLRQLTYSSPPLRFSDHKPVYGTFLCEVSVIDEQLRQQIHDDIYRRRKAEVGDATAGNAGAGVNSSSGGSGSGMNFDDTDDEDLLGYDAVEPGLPPASSDRRRWWLDNGKAARSEVLPPRGPDGLPMTLNPRRPSNPFGPTDEPDWVSVSRSASRMSISSLSMSTSPYEHVSLATTPGRQPPQQQPQLSRGLHSGTPPRFGSVGSVSLASASTLADREPPVLPPPRRQTWARTDQARTGATADLLSLSNTGGPSSRGNPSSPGNPSSGLDLLSLSTSGGPSSRGTPLNSSSPGLVSSAAAADPAPLSTTGGPSSRGTFLNSGHSGPSSAMADLLSLSNTGGTSSRGTPPLNLGSLSSAATGGSSQGSSQGSSRQQGPTPPPPPPPPPPVAKKPAHLSAGTAAATTSTGSAGSVDEQQPRPVLRKPVPGRSVREGTGSGNGSNGKIQSVDDLLGCNEDLDGLPLWPALKPTA